MILLKDHFWKMYPTSPYLILYPSSDPAVLNMSEVMLAHNGLGKWFLVFHVSESFPSTKPQH